MCVWTHRLRPDAPGTWDALDAPWQRTYRSQHKTHRQCEFGHSLPWHHAPGYSSPRHHAPGRSSSRHLLTRRSVAGHFRSRYTVSGHFPSGRTVSGHFPSGRSRVRAFSFWTQPCQGKWHPDDACHGTVVTLCDTWVRRYRGGGKDVRRVRFNFFIHSGIILGLSCRGVS